MVHTGTVDLANELQCSTQPGLERAPLQTSLQHTLLAAKSGGCQAIDGVYVHLMDETGFEKECQAGVDLGFDGKSLVHPKTVDVANRYFSPSEKELEHAHRIVAAYEQSDKGATLVDGKLVEELHIRRALKLIEFARIIEQRG